MAQTHFTCGEATFVSKRRTLHRSLQPRCLFCLSVT